MTPVTVDSTVAEAARARHRRRSRRRANLRDILELDDYIVETATTLAEALDRHDWGELSAIILDRQLPDGGAIGSCRHSAHSLPMRPW